MVQSATAIFAINDELAIGILRGLIEHGISIPKDISLIGYDDIDYAAYVSPPLTTVAQPITDIGKTSLTLLLQRLQHLDKSIDMIELSTTLKFVQQLAIIFQTNYVSSEIYSSLLCP